jgi:radical SAM protein with 4Fe4S-binding SPASM domain
MRCSFCYSRIVRVERCGHDRDYSRHLRFVHDNAAEIGTINWGTSENALLDAWFDLVAEIQEIAPHVVQGVTTNGRLGARCRERPRCLNVFRSCLRDVDVSVDFADAGRHNEFRGHSRAFEMAMESLRLCRDAGVPRSVVVLGATETLSRDNLSGIFAIAAEFGAHVRVNLLRPVRACGLSPVPYPAVKDAVTWLARTYPVVSLGDPLFAALLGLESLDPSGARSLRILPDGSVTPSTFLVEPPWIAGNVLEEAVDLESLPGRRPFRALAETSVPSACADCPVVGRCRGGCKDRRVLAFGTLAEADPYCPMRHGEGPDAWGGPDGIRFGERRGPLIHEGYLPTLIFGTQGVS